MHLSLHVGDFTAARLVPSLHVSVIFFFACLFYVCFTYLFAKSTGATGAFERRIINTSLSRTRGAGYSFPLSFETRQHGRLYHYIFAQIKTAK